MHRAVSATRGGIRKEKTPFFVQDDKRAPQVVPGSVWGLVDEMLPATARLQPLGARIEVANLRDEAQLEQRARLAASSAAISAFASGVHQLNRCAMIPYRVLYKLMFVGLLSHHIRSYCYGNLLSASNLWRILSMRLADTLSRIISIVCSMYLSPVVTAFSPH